MGDDGLGTGSGPAHRRRVRPAGAGGRRAQGGRPQSALGDGYPARSRAHAATGGPGRRDRHAAGLAGRHFAPTRRLRRNGNAATHRTGCLLPRPRDGQHHGPRRGAERPGSQRLTQAADTKII